MSNILALTCSSGKVFNRKSRDPQDGVALTIDFTVSKPKAQAKALSAAGESFVLADSKGTLRYFNLPANKFSVVARSCICPTALALIPNNPAEVAVGLRNKNLEIYSLTGKLVAALRGHKEPIKGIAVNQLKGVLLSYSADCCVLWRMSDWSRIRSLAAQNSCLVNAAFGGPMQSIITCFRDGALFEWDLNNYELKRKMKVKEEAVGVCVLQGNWVAAVGASGQVTVWSREGTQPLFTCKLPSEFGKTKNIEKFKGKCMALLGERGDLKVFDLETGQVTFTVRGILSFSVGGNRVFCVLLNGNVTVYEVHNKGKPLKRPESPPKQKTPQKTGQRTEQATAQSTAQSTAQKTEQLRKMLKKYSEYPEKHRASIWKTLLELPENKDEFEKLLNRGEHESVQSLRLQYPLQDKKLLRVFSETMSALAHWCPMAAEGDWVAPLVFPFVKLTHNSFTSFEFAVSLLTHWLQHWFENYPDPPVKLLVAIEQIIELTDKDLVLYLHSLGVQCVSYIWPVLKSLFTLSFTKEEWSSLMDHLFTYNANPELLLFYTASFFIQYKQLLLGLHTKEDLEYFLNKQNPVNLKELLQLTKQLYRRKTEITLPHYEPRALLTPYPVLANYPDFALIHSEQIRERLLQEDRELLSKQEHLSQVSARLAALGEQETLFRKQQEALLHSELARQQSATLEHTLKLEERQKVDRHLKAQRLTQIRELESSLSLSLQNSTLLRQQELERLSEAIEQQRAEDKYSAAQQTEEEALALVEFQGTQRLLELMRVKSTEESLRRLRTDKDHWQQEQRAKDCATAAQWRIEDEQRRFQLEALREQKQRELLLLTEQNDRKQMETQQKLAALEHELAQQQLGRERKLRQFAESELLSHENALAQRQLTLEDERKQQEKSFQGLLTQEKQGQQGRAESRASQLLSEAQKQEQQMQLQRQEIVALRKGLDDGQLRTQLNTLQHQEALQGLEEEKQLQQMLLKIEEERGLQHQLTNDFARKESELRNKLTLQESFRREEDVRVTQQREDFAKYREDLQQESAAIESARGKAHQVKMNAIIKQREDELQFLDDPQWDQPVSSDCSCSAREDSSECSCEDSPRSMD